eukprot:404158-Pyramimonas_sp.AAC.1
MSSASAWNLRVRISLGTFHEQAETQSATALCIRSFGSKSFPCAHQTAHGLRDPKRGAKLNIDEELLDNARRLHQQPENAVH